MRKAYIYIGLRYARLRRFFCRRRNRITMSCGTGRTTTIRSESNQDALSAYKQIEEAGMVSYKLYYNIAKYIL